MEPTVVERAPLTLVGLVSYGGDLGELWQRFTAAEHLLAAHAVPGLAYELHLYPEDFTNGTPYYLVAREVMSLGDVPHVMFAKTLPAGTWAAFTRRCGVESYDVLNARINAWLESGPYRHARNLSLQVYDARFKGFEDSDSQLELWIPVVPK